MHRSLLDLCSLLLHILDLLGDFANKILLVLKELVKVSLLIALLDRVNLRLESAAFEIFVLQFFLHLLDLEFLLLIEFVYSRSKFFFIEGFLHQT